MQKRSVYQQVQQNEVQSSVSEARGNLSERLLKGALAGAVGGLVGAEVKALAEKVFPPRPQGAESPPVKTAKKAIGAEQVRGHEAAAEEGIHWTFSALVGGAYGAMAEVAPAVSRFYGAPFGAVLFSLTHETALPLLGVASPSTQNSTKLQANELTTHLIYGLTTDVVRRTVRKRL